MKRYRPLFFSGALSIGLLAHAQPASVLFVGNSYTGTNNLPGMVSQLAASLGTTVSTGMVTPGGYTFLQHSTSPTTLSTIASQQWDYVVLQEQSQLGALPPDYNATAASATVLVDSIRAASECSRPVFYMTWGRQNGDAQFCPSFPYMCTYEGMQQALRENYLAMAEDNNAYTAPVGMAWKQVRDTHPGLQLYVGDGSHPSVQGTYLAACVFYCTLFQQPCTGASYTGTLSADTAAILQGIASATVLDSMALWNLDLPEGIGAAITGSTSSAWNTVTFHHSGTGTHLWTCSDGQTSTDANPTFTVDTPGTFTFSHTYTDPCGNTDTVTWTYDFIVSGIDPGAIQDGITVTATEGTIVLRGAAGGDTLTIYDLAGRAVIAVVRGNGTLTVPSSPGVRIWSLHRSNGERISGRVVVQ